MNRVVSRSNIFALYLYLDESDYQFKMGDIDTAKNHKWEFNDSEINWLRWENKNFDDEYLVMRKLDGGKYD